MAAKFKDSATIDSAQAFMVAFKSGSVAAFPLRENMHWTHLLGSTFTPFFPDHSETHSRALLLMEIPWVPYRGGQ